MDTNTVRDNYLRIKDDIERLRAQGKAGEVEICAAAKTVAPDIINSLVPYGLKRIGENRLNELNEKFDAYDPSLTVDFIGTLQSNKIRQLCGRVSLIQSLGTLSAAKELERVSAARGMISDVLVEINSGREPNKSGVLPEDAESFFDEIAPFEHVRPLGLMTVGAIESEKSEYIKYFGETYKIFIDILTKKLHNIDGAILSMGMSGNYIEAVECGATMIRPGRALFGERI